MPRSLNQIPSKHWNGVLRAKCTSALKGKATTGAFHPISSLAPTAPVLRSTNVIMMTVSTQIASKIIVERAFDEGSPITQLALGRNRSFAVLRRNGCFNWCVDDVYHELDKIMGNTRGGDIAVRIPMPV